MFYSLLTSLDLGLRLWFSVNSKPGGNSGTAPKQTMSRKENIPAAIRRVDGVIVTGGS
ncbi:MAG: hypothetical protein HFG49_12140 [Lachnospiraceae bacterium]|nr:hypothetical protein [Lachnospiraceae bacterium]